jgi:CubicO group peptidase (beta-lactamase class C family)
MDYHARVEYGPDSSAPPVNSRQGHQASVRELCDEIESTSFSGAISIILRGEVLLEFAGGWCNRERKEPNHLDTRFATASVSKMFTAVCLARLVDAGLCRFDQPVAELEPSLALQFDSAVSLASLLSHRSGLGDYIDDDAELPFAGMDMEHLDCPWAFLPYVLRAERHAAGQYRYSSAGYILLGLAIEAITGMPFPAAMDKWVFDPAGLRHTGFPALTSPVAGVAVGYLPDGQVNFGHLPPIGGPDGGIVTNVADVRRLFDCLRKDDLLSHGNREFLFQETSQISDKQAYGHGFKIIRVGGETWYGHTGSDPGVSARVAFLRERESSIIILSNADAQAFRIFRLMLDWLERRDSA